MLPPCLLLVWAWGRFPGRRGRVRRRWGRPEWQKRREPPKVCGDVNPPRDTSHSLFGKEKILLEWKMESGVNIHRVLRRFGKTRHEKEIEARRGTAQAGGDLQKPPKHGTAPTHETSNDLASGPAARMRVKDGGDHVLKLASLPRSVPFQFPVVSFVSRLRTECPSRLCELYCFIPACSNELNLSFICSLNCAIVGLRIY